MATTAAHSTLLAGPAGALGSMGELATDLFAA